MRRNKNLWLKCFALVMFTCAVQIVNGQEEESGDMEIFDLSLEQLLDLDVVDEKFQLYGYINSNFEKVFSIPSLENGVTVTQDDPKEWTPIKAFHLYGQGNIGKRVSVLFNLAGSQSGFEVRNAWGNFKIKDEFQIRVGRMYRKFGLYNEKLDQIPTFIGIEPPELFDSDHLFLSRTTDVMIHGTFLKDKLSYAITSGNAEAGPTKGVLPIGWDFRYKSLKQKLIIGTSGYQSSITNNLVTSTVGLGEGSAKGGVLPWMTGDRYNVIGLFVEKKIGKVLIQSEFWTSAHKALRDPASVLTIIQNNTLNRNQLSNFLGDSDSNNLTSISEDDVIINANYTSKTFYVRASYEIKSSIGQIIPYLFYDWMSNPELIQSKTYGGDNEAGLSDNGIFTKPSIGVFYKPIRPLAIKLDGSMHSQLFNGKRVNYPEIRIDFSFAFDAVRGF